MHAIIEAVDTMTKIHDSWVADTRKTGEYANVLPREFETAVEQLFEVTRLTDVPPQLRTLVRAIDAFEVEWQAYIAGAWENEGEPLPTLWRTLREVFHHRSLSTELRPKMPEPVHVLLTQKVSHNQIAHHIYGWRGTGPFLDDSGNVRIDLIEKEAKEPGSVVKEGWIPEQEKDRLKQYHIDTAQRLKSLDTLATGPKKAPETVEGLLREGQYPDVIAKVCGVEIEQVHKIAEVLGIEVKFRPNLAAERAPQEPEIHSASAAAMDAYTPGKDAEEQRRAPVKSKDVSEATRQRIFEIHTSAPDMGAGEIAKEVGGVNAREVAQILRELEKSAPPAQV